MSIEQLSKNDIKDIFTNTVYKRGVGYYREGRVRDLYHDPVRNIWSATVRGSKSYKVTIEEDEFGINSECNCPAYGQYWEPCKHIAAVMLKIHDQEQNVFSTSDTSGRSNFLTEARRKQVEEVRRRQSEYEKLQEERMAVYVTQLTNQFIQTVSGFSQEGLKEERAKHPLMVDWIVKIQKPYFTSMQFLNIEMKVGQKRTYVVKKIKDFLHAIERHIQYPFTKNFTYDPMEQMFTAADQEIISLLDEAVKYEELYRELQPSYYQTSNQQDERGLNIPPMLSDQLLNLLNTASTQFEINGQVYQQMILHHHELPVSIRLDKGKTSGFQMDLTELRTMTYLNLYGYMIKDQHIYKLAPDQQILIKELTQLINKANKHVIPIANEQMETFISHAVPVIGKSAKLEISDNVAGQIVKLPLQAKVFIDLIDEFLSVIVEFHYGEHKINPFQQVTQTKTGPIIMREADKEHAIMDVVESSSLNCNVIGLYAEGEEEIFEFLYEVLPRLEGKAEIFLTNAVKSLVLSERPSPVTNIEVNASGNLLEINFDIEGINREQIQSIMQSVMEKKKYYRLPDGAFVPLEAEEFQMIQTIMNEFQIKPQQLQQEAIKLPVYRGMQLDDIMNKEDGGNAKYGRQFHRLLSRLKNPEELDCKIPKSIQAELRDYQYYGYQWLRTLRYYHLGGILADDMGLGKTLQSIAFILSIFEENRDVKPALIVAPASLVYNWKNEFQKFAPTLTAEVLIGTPQERVDKLQNQPLPNVWITSYPTLRQDSEFYNEHQFSILILDEAQIIKNYLTKTAKAVREIQAETVIALSGTPIENSVDELWSIFQTVMPAFFPNQKLFRQLEPEKIARMIRPFLLRRVKKDVVKELPDKIETVHYSELTKQQKKLYLAYLERIRQETKESLETDGYQKSQIKILAGLTRLRQLCCHPSLFLEDYHEDSGKLEQLMEIVEPAVENGRRILIFSQFTSMLSFIKEKLQKLGIEFFYLDGQIKPKDRVDMVDQFNQGTGDVFLLSLKAGNTGLNLTGADTVILYDLWWNPAVEEQAAGRAHRIGQKNVVQVIRLITQGTIEEKIFELQQTKKELIDTVLNSGDQAMTKLTEQEIRKILNI
ncbi:MAG TPA: DEAD/DEAH box helicase [Bacillales bacterium]|nr:DEAD/DEAH box helicase [Bacillales bacterium]